MSELKTKKNSADVDKFLGGIKEPQMKADCLTVLELMRDLTGQPAAM